jgi:hypothetical protein
MAEQNGITTGTIDLNSPGAAAQQPAPDSSGIQLDLSKSTPVASAPEDLSAVKLDLSKSTPIAPPQKRDESYAGHNFDPLNLGDWKRAFVGPTTAAGQQLGPGMQEDVNAVADLLHGDFKKGTEKFLANNSMHVVQGSPIEKLIQQFNPDFKGAVDQNWVDKNRDTTLDHPMVDSAQFIDKQAHPVTKALTEVAQSLTSPTNTAIMIGTGGLGMVSSVRGLAVANKLLSAGFTAQALAGAYKNLEGFKKAYDEGDETEALYMLTHAVANGTMGYLAGAHTAGVETPLASKTDIAVARAVKNAPARTMGALDTILGRTNDFGTAIERSSKIPAKQVQIHREKIANVKDDLQAIANDNKDTIEDPKTFADAIDRHIQSNEAQLQARAGATQNSTVPVTPDVEVRLRNHLDKFFDDNRGKFGTPEEVDQAKQAVMDRILQRDQVGVDAQGNPMYANRAPNLFESENIRQGLNIDSKPQYAANARPTTDAYKVGAKQAADLLREVIDESYDKSGVTDVKEWRSKEANLIDVRDRLKDAQTKAEEMGQPGIWKSIVKKYGVPSTILGIALGTHAPITLGALAPYLAGERVYQNLKNPNLNVNRALELANPNAKATEPTFGQPTQGGTPAPGAPPAAPAPQPNHALHAALSTHYGEVVGTSPLEDLEARFYTDIQNKQAHGVPLEPAEKQMLSKVNDAKTQERLDAQDAQTKAAEKAAKDAEKQAADRQKAAEEAQKLKEEKAAEEEKGQKKTLDGVAKELTTDEKGNVIPVEPPDLTGEKPKPAGRTNLIGKLTHVVHPDNLENAADQRIQRTPARALFGHSDESALGHEWAHAAQAAIEGLGSGDISSHHHPDSQPTTPGGSPAFGGVERGKAPWIESETAHDNHTREAILENTKAHIRVNMAGAVANEMLHGIPIEDNAGLHTDMAQSKQWLEAHGIEGADADAMVQDAINTVREGFTKHPQILDAIRENSHVRERGLSPQLHASRERVAKFGDHIKDIIDANENNGPNDEGNRGDKGKLDAGRQGSVREAGKEAASEENGREVKPGRAAVAGVAEAGPQGGHAGGGVASEEELARPGRFVKVSRSGAPTDQGKTPDFNLRPGEAGYQVTKEGPRHVAGEESAATKRGAEAYHKEVFGQRANLQGPPEKTTGSPETDEAIRAGGGVPGGKFGDLAMFHHPNGTTLAMRPEGITPESVREHIGKKTEEYTQGDLRNAARAINPDFNPAPVQPDPRESEIADAYKAAKHEPNNPAVKASYDALKRDIDSQYDKLKGMGFKLETAKENPYGLSSEIPAHEELHRDVLRNKHLAVWEGGAPPADHPLSERDPKTGLTYNDKFRMVHDVFGHAAERTDFSPAGEESAWNLHRQLFSPEARPALATETRGQAAYTYKYGDFPPQKATILPEHLQVRPEDLGKRTELRGATQEAPLRGGEVLDRMRKGIGETEDASGVKGGASFITPEGTFIHLPAGMHHPDAVREFGGRGSFGMDIRPEFMEESGAVRLRQNNGRAGETLQVSVPAQGVNEAQADAIRRAVAANGRNGNVYLERADVSPETKDSRTATKEFATPADVGGMLRKIDAHPDKNAVPNDSILGDQQKRTELRGAAALAEQEWHEKVAARVPNEPAGGVDPYTGESEKEGLGTELVPEARRPLDHPPTAQDFKDYRDQHEHLFQTHPELKVGWDTLGQRPELNVAATGPNAEEVARKLDQRSAYDIANRKEIPTGGKGEVTQFPDYPIEQRLADLKKEPEGGRSELRGKTLSPAAQKMVDKVKEEAYANYSPDEIRNGDPWISPVDKEAGGKPSIENSDAGFLHPDGSISLIESAYQHDPFLAALGDDFSEGKFIKKTGSGTFDMFDENGHGASGGTPKTFSLTLGDKPTPQQIETIAAMVNHLRAGGEGKFQTVDISWPGNHKVIDFATPGSVVRELGGGRSELRGKPSDSTEVHPIGSSVGLRTNPLPLKPSTETGVPSTVDVAMALNKFTKKQLPALQLGKAEPEEMVARAKSLAEDEAKYQLAQNNTGAAWYTTQMADHDRILQGIRPELKDPAKLSIFKMAEAILSSGQKPYQNLKTNMRAWDQYQETGKFSPTNPDTGQSWGPRGIPAYGNAFQSLNRLIAEKGEQGASDWLLGDHTVKELKEYNDNVAGKADDVVPGAYILGPKRGPFAQNLHGKESAFTADMWVARTWNRWMGTAEVAPDGELYTDRPRSGRERELMKKSFSETADKLGMTTSSLQAVLWYYEQALYSAHGSAKESWSFSDAAQRIADDENSSFKFGHNVPEAKSGLDILAGKR